MTNEILKSYKFRIYPDSDQKQKLNQTFGCVRVIWNSLVNNFNSYGTENYLEKFSEKEIKHDPDRPWLKEVSSGALQQKRIDFNETKSQFFNKKRKIKIGRMKFKSKNNRQSYRLPNQKFKLDQENSLVKLEKISPIKVVLDRKIPEDADFRNITVSKTPTGKYFVSILVKINVDLKPMTGKKIGIDLGLIDLFNFSNGKKVNNPRWFRESQAKLAKAQKHLSRKKKGSNRRTKQRLKVARIHEKIANQRKDFLQKMSSKLVSEFDVICVEDLNVSGMKKNSRLAKSISDAGWSSFISMLNYKCSWYGKSLVKIDRFYPSSQICSNCNHRDGKKDLSIREWICSSCGTSLDRDLNAARNILNKGFSDLTGTPVNETSVELIDYKRGEDVRLGEKIDAHLATSVKRLDKSRNLS